MDKYEYKVRAEQIKSLLARKEYVEAMKVADTIDWRRVKSISMLCTVSEIYKINRKYEESRDILLLAYERYPTGRTIVYALCELSIKMGEFVQAVEYYKEFLQIAPKDSGRYILQYKLYEAQEVSIEERIAVLEEFKEKDYREKWAYELAYLYHRIGLATQCVEECNDLILWFGEGKYVQKAMELKMLYEPLSKAQQEKFDQQNAISQGEEFFNEVSEEEPAEEQRIPIQIKGVEASQEPTMEIPSRIIEDEIQVKPVNMGKYSTINLQEELSKSIHELFEESEEQGVRLQEVAEEEIGQEEPYFIQNEADVHIPVPAEDEDAEEITLEELSKEEPEEVIIEEEPAVNAESSGEFDRILSQEYDGQIRLVVPEPEIVEKQITGQMDISDVMAEWDRMKKENDQRRIMEAKKKSLEQTNDIMSQYVGVLPGIEKNIIPGEDETGELPEIAEPAADDFEEETDSAAVEELIPEEEIVGEPEEVYDFGEESEGVEREPEEEEPDAEEEFPEEEPDREEILSQYFGDYIEMAGLREQINTALDNIRMVGVTGNVIITGNEPAARVKMALAVAKAVQQTNVHFLGRVAKISGDLLNTKDIPKSMEVLKDGALIIEKAGNLTVNTLDALAKSVNYPEARMLLIIEDSKAGIRKLQKLRKYFDKLFTATINIPTFSNDDLVNYAKDYAREREYTIDEMGILALYTRIDEMQTADHFVTMQEVEEIMDEAIRHVDKKNVNHLMDILFAKRYDDDDLIILREKDFIRN